MTDGNVIKLFNDEPYLYDAVIKMKVKVMTYVPLSKSLYFEHYEMTVGELKGFTDDLRECAEMIVSVKLIDNENIR